MIDDEDYDKIKELERHLFLNIMDATGQLLGHTVVVVYALMGLTGSIYGNGALLAQVTKSLYMVSVIMGHKHCHNLLKRDTGILKVSLYLSHGDAGVNQDCMFVCAKIVAVSAATAGKTPEYELLLLHFTKSGTKVQQKLHIRKRSDIFFAE